MRLTAESGKYTVVGSTGNKYTIVYLPESNSYSCTCPDHIHRKHVCKHIHFVLQNKKQTQTQIKGWDDMCSICMDPVNNGTSCIYCKTCCRCVHIACFQKWKQVKQKSICLFCKQVFDKPHI
jgi:hypothetical protein